MVCYEMWTGLALVACKDDDDEILRKIHSFLRRWQRQGVLGSMQMTSMCYGAFQEIEEQHEDIATLLEKGLELDPGSRWSAKDCLESPLFIGRTVILPPPRKEVTTVKLCKNRSYFKGFVSEFLQSKDRAQHFSYRLLFHAVDVLDRLLDQVEDEDAAKDQDFYFHCCYYLMYRYFNSVGVKYSIAELFPEWSRCERLPDSLESLDVFIRDKVMGHVLHRTTLYELADKDGITDEYAAKLMRFYLSLPAGTYDLTELYKQCKKVRNNGVNLGVDQQSREGAQEDGCSGRAALATPRPTSCS